MAAILLIEDDQRIRESLARTLSDGGHEVRSERLGADGARTAVSEPIDLVVLDLGLPDLDGSTVLQMIRSVSKVPVIVATARDEEMEIVRLINLGADDYVVKPFSADQLEARIRAVLRRVGGDGGADVLRVGELEIDTASHEVRLAGELIDLTAKEFELLAYLASRAGVMVSKRQLLAEVWRRPYGGADKTVDVHLSWLRRKLGETAAQPRYLHTKRGVGIKLVDPEGG